MTDSLTLSIDQAKRTVDALCHAHKHLMHEDAARSLHLGVEEIEERPLTREVEAALKEMRAALETVGVAW